VITPATLNLTGELAIYQNASYLLACVATDENDDPINLAGYAIDADIKNANDQQLATFTCAPTDAAAGEFSISMLPATTLALTPGSYLWDLSLTAPGGTRYYWAAGSVSVIKTQSRN
jgi:hypothetical protein